MSTCVESSGGPSSGPKPNCTTAEIRTTNINFNNNYHNYGNEMAVTTLPSLQTLSTLNCSDIGIDVNSYGNSCVNQTIRTMSSMSSKSVPSVESNPEWIQIPFGWKRELIDGQIVYYSPTNCCLRSLEELSKYLESDGTCKCGLECPLHISKAFNFEPSVVSKPYDIEVAKSSNQNELCNHKRKIIALATYRHHSLQTQQLIAEQKQNQTRLVHKPESDSKLQQHFQSDDNSCAQNKDKDCLNSSNETNISSEDNQITAKNSSTKDSISVIQSNESLNKSDQCLTQSMLSQISYNCPILCLKI